jgi:hypothetical protein
MNNAGKTFGQNVVTGFGFGVGQLLAYGLASLVIGTAIFVSLLGTPTTTPGSNPESPAR